MPINQLVQFCNDSINKNGKCTSCTYECTNRCKICLQSIHDDQTTAARHYDCDNMIYCYTCSYIYKHASEIFYAFQMHPCTSFERFNVLSIGCGNCADLFGLYHFLTIRERLTDFTYLGVDYNAKWGSTHNHIIRMFPDNDIRFIYTNAFDYIDTLSDFRFNTVVLEYVINEIRKYTPEKVDEFVCNFVQKVINRLPDNSIVIINDFNHKLTRDIFWEIFKLSQQTNLVTAFSYRFSEPSTHTYGGQMHPYSGLAFTPLRLGHDVKTPCSSAQLIIFKTKNS